MKETLIKKDKKMNEIKKGKEFEGLFVSLKGGRSKED